AHPVDKLGRETGPNVVHDRFPFASYDRRQLTINATRSLFSARATPQWLLVSPPSRQPEMAWPTQSAHDVVCRNWVTRSVNTNRPSRLMRIAITKARL